MRKCGILFNAEGQTCDLMLGHTGQHDLVSPRRLLLGFVYEASSDTYIVRTQRLFKPRGFFIFDCPPRYMVSAVMVGNREEVLASVDPVPARLFSLSVSFEELARSIEEGKEPLSTWMSLPEVYPGVDIRVMLRENSLHSTIRSKAPIDLQMAMWGESVL